jgi:hypothetical protein
LYHHQIAFINQRLFSLSERTQHFEHCAFIYHLQNVSPIVAKNRNITGKGERAEDFPFLFIGLKYRKFSHLTSHESNNVSLSQQHD